MTNHQKNMIFEMRKAGNSYGQIAQSLSLSENTVKTYCNRNRLGKDSIANTTFCKQCHCFIEIKSKFKPRRFCPDKCRITLWYANHKSYQKTE